MVAVIKVTKTDTKEDEEPSKANLDATKVGEYDWHAEAAAVLSNELYAGAGTFVRAARKAGIIRPELAPSLPEVSLEQLNGRQQLAAAIPVAHMHLQSIRVSKPLPASPLDVGCVDKQHLDSFLEMLNMQMLGQVGCGKSYCLGAMSKLANEFISSVSIAD